MGSSDSPLLHPSKACPFCRHEEVTLIQLEDTRYVAHCVKCHAEGPPQPTVTDAAIAWNGALLTAPDVGFLSIQDMARELIDREDVIASLVIITRFCNSQESVEFSAGGSLLLSKAAMREIQPYLSKYLREHISGND